MALHLRIVETAVPIFPHGFASHAPEGFLHAAHAAGVAHGELLQGFGVRGIAARFGVAACRHGGHAECRHVVAEVGFLARGIGNVHVVVEDTHGEGELRQFPVGHHAVGLKAAVLGRAEAGEVHAVLRTPVAALQVAQVEGHHREVGAPFLFKADEHAHADGVHARRAHAVEAVHAPLEVRLHAARVIKFVVLAVIGFLKANHAVHAVVRKRSVVLLG